MTNYAHISKLSIKHRLLSGGSWAFIGKIFASFFGLVVNALLTRLLSPEEMGTYFLTLSLAGITALVSQLGMNQLTVRLISESRAKDRLGQAHSAVKFVFYLGTIGSVAAAGILIWGPGKWVSINLFNSPVMAGLIGLVAVWSIAVTFQSLLSESFRGFNDIFLATIFGGFATSVFFSLLLVAAWVKYGHLTILQVLILAIIARFTSATIAGIFLHNKISPFKGDNNIKYMEILSSTWPFLITGVTLFALNQVDIWIIGTYCSQAEVAIYGAVKRLLILVSAPLLIINAVVPPLISELYVQNKKSKLEQTLRSVSTIAGIPSIGILTVFIIFGMPILRLIYGDFYEGGANILIILAAGKIFSVCSGSCGITLMMTGYQKTMMNITILSGIFMFAGSLIAVRYFGFYGVACVGAFTSASQNILMLLYAKNRSGVWTHMQFDITKIGRTLA